MQILKNKKIWTMLGFTALFLIIYRFGVSIHLPFIDREFIKGEPLSFGFLEVFTGGALRVSRFYWGINTHHSLNCYPIITNGYYSSIKRGPKRW